MKIRVLASESMGVRSLATVVEVHGYKICIDPGASLAPRRYGLPPHSIELEELGKRLNTIRNEVRSCDIIIITHYHRDHYLYRDDEIELYNDKILFIKDPRRNINFSQRLRAHNLLVKHGVEKKANTVFYADGKTYDIEGVKLFFSKPVPHGAEGTKLGYVLMVLIDDGEDTMAFASDVQGPISGEAYRILSSWKPESLVISGPPTYFAGFKVPSEVVDKGLNNLRKLAEIDKIPLIIADHHLLRDINYYDKIKHMVEASKSLGNNMLTAAEYMGEEIRQLEAFRKQLYSSG